ncbi:GPW/gp25 family protein [Buttiauxella sp. A2-C1_F]|nr:GPW/gp25 family protein [Buttiauxella sp. A2-C1_F]
MNNSLLQRLADDMPDSIEDEWETKSHWIFDELRMLFDSRPRIRSLEENNAVNSTVINYGLDEGFYSQESSIARGEIMRLRIENLLARFEPRLIDVSVNIHQPNLPRVEFIIQAQWNDQSLSCTLIWDDAMSTFYLNEQA